MRIHRKALLLHCATLIALSGIVSIAIAARGSTLDVQAQGLTSPSGSESGLSSVKSDHARGDSFVLPLLPWMLALSPDAEDARVRVNDWSCRPGC